MQNDQTSRRRGCILVAIATSVCLAAGTAAPAVASPESEVVHAAPATAGPERLVPFLRSVFTSGAQAVRPATRSVSTRTSTELAENASAARSTVGTAESASGSRVSRSNTNAGRLAGETVETRFQRWLSEDGPEILRETECTLIFDQMYPDEQDAVEGVEGLEPAGSQSPDPVVSASADAIAQAAVRRAARAVERPMAVTTEWVQWGQGVQENATAALGGSNAVAGLSRTVELDDGMIVSLALVGYARYCLRPPR